MNTVQRQIKALEIQLRRQRNPKLRAEIEQAIEMLTCKTKAAML